MNFLGMVKVLPWLGKTPLKLLLIMKMTAFFLVIAFQAAALDEYAQGISLNEKNTPLQQVFEKIKSQSGYVFWYNDAALRNARPVSVDIKNKTIEETLDIVLKGQPLIYEIVERIVMIRIKAEAKKEDWKAKFLPIDVRGRVVNEKGEPVEAVSVRLKGSNNGTITNANGEFLLKNIPEDGILLFSGVNIENVEWKLTGSSEMMVNVKTKVSKEQEVEVVSTGYQLIAKERATGSFTKLGNEILNRKASTNITERITEITSGMYYIPSNEGDLRRTALPIRGFSSINGNTNPLIVVDGFPFDDGSLNLSNIGNINPNDVESITILKDAAAASIWGARSGNGVIIITTKRGKYNQRPNIQYRQTVTLGEKPDLSKVPMISSKDEIEFEKLLFSQQYYQWVEDAVAWKYFAFPLPPVYELLIAKKNGVISEQEADAKISYYEKTDIKSQIKEHLLQKSIIQQYSINFSGGSPNYNYYVSAGYDKNRLHNVGNDNNRLTLRFDNTLRIIKNMEFVFFLTYVQSKNTNSSFDYFSFLPGGSSQLMVPYTQFADDSGNPLSITRGFRTGYLDTLSPIPYQDWHYYPLKELSTVINESKQSNSRFGGSIRYGMLSGLTLELKGQYEKGLTNSQIFNSVESYFARDMINKYLISNQNGNIQYPIPLGGIKDISQSSLSTWSIRSQLTYTKKLNLSEVNAIGGFEARSINSDFNRFRQYGFDSETNTFAKNVDYATKYLLNPDRVTKQTIPNNDTYSGQLSRFLSYYLNAAYTFKGKYTLSVSGRKDGANLFGVKTNDKITPLWSTGLLWDIHKESFFSYRNISLLRIRASFGYNGNLKNDATSFETIRYGTSASFTGLPYAFINKPPNPQLRWEKVRVFNIGVDFAAFNSKLQGSIEFYKKDGIDLISTIDADPTSGVSFYTGNNASIKGKGFDINLTTTNSTGRLKWQTTLLISYNTNRVKSYSVKPTVQGVLSGNAPIVGKPLSSLFSYRTATLDPTNGNPQGFLADTIVSYNLVLKGNNTKPEDLVFHGSTEPKVFGSIRNTFGYGKMELSFTILYRFGYYFRRSSINYSNLYEYWSGHSDYTNRWQKPGDETLTTIPSLPTFADNNRDRFYLNSSSLVEKADHIRLYDLRLAYNVETLGKIPLKQLNIFVYLTNLGLLWKANSKSIDPEYKNVPAIRTYSFGINANF